MGRPRHGLAGRVGRGAGRGRYRPFSDVSQVRDEALLPHHDAVQGLLDAGGRIVLTGLLCLVALFTVMLLGHAERRHVRLAAV